MKTAIEIAGSVVVCGWFFVAFVRTFCTDEAQEEEQ